MNFNELLKHKREDVLRVAARYGAYNVRIFGSVARGEADEASDLDVLLIWSRGAAYLILGGLLMELQELLGLQVDVVTEQGLRPRIGERVLREAVPL